jgi:hypothetical protein
MRTAEEIWRELAAPLPSFDALVKSYEFRQPGHDVSDEPRDEQGRWTDGGGDGDGGEGAAEKPSGDEGPTKDEDMRLIGSGVDKSRVVEWQKGLQEQLDALEKQGKVGDTEWTNINRIEVALGHYLEASEKERADGHLSLREVHDGNNKLLSAVTTQFNPETKISTILALGGIDHKAYVKALEHTIYHERDGNKAERIETVIFTTGRDFPASAKDDETGTIAAMEAAGFNQHRMETAGVVRMSFGAEGKTSAEKAKEEKEAAQHSAEILGAAKATGKLLGYDPKLIKVNDGNSPFTLGGVQRQAAGLAHLTTGVIEIFPKHVYSIENAVPITAHEIGHQKFQTVLNALKAERADASKLEAAELDRGNAITNPDGTLKPEYRDLFPLVARFEKHVATLDARIAADGVSSYSKDWWKEYQAHVASVQSAVHETIAEMAYAVANGDKLPGSPQWKSYYNDIMKTYDELKAKK